MKYSINDLKGQFKVMGYDWPKFHIVAIRSKANAKNQFDDLQRQILSIKNMQEEDQQKMAGILSNIKAIEKDINTTQELQRLQAQKLSEIIKKRK
jgi:peptidoglycan hydrolase CwlO-like protein